MKAIYGAILGALILSPFAMPKQGRLAFSRACAQDFAPPRNVAEGRALFRRGAELWPVYCNTCHNARPGAEFSSVEWKMILMHMRMQANLPASDAQAILQYLQASK
jgi:mono/diheme cytochrome c family protein